MFDAGRRGAGTGALRSYLTEYLAGCAFGRLINAPLTGLAIDEARSDDRVCPVPRLSGTDLKYSLLSQLSVILSWSLRACTWRGMVMRYGIGLTFRAYGHPFRGDRRWWRACLTRRRGVNLVSRACARIELTRDDIY